MFTSLPICFDHVFVTYFLLQALNISRSSPWATYTPRMNLQELWNKLTYRRRELIQVAYYLNNLNRGCKFPFTSIYL